MMISIWTIILVLSCLGIIVIGFCLQMGFEFTRFRSVLSRARYLSILDYQLALESKFWKISKSIGGNTVLITGSYPRIVKGLPFILFFDRLNVCYRDEDDPAVVADYSQMMNFPAVHRWIQILSSYILRILSPEVHFHSIDLLYSYKYMQSEFESNFASVRIHLATRSVHTGVSSCKLYQKKSEFLAVSLPVGCVYEKNLLTFDSVVFDSYFDTIEDIELLILSFSQSSSLAPTTPHLGVNMMLKSCSVRLHLQSKNLVLILNLEPRNGGLFLSTVWDIHTMSIFSFEFHNFDIDRRGKQISFMLTHNLTSVISLHCYDCKCTADYKSKTYNLNFQIKNSVASLLESKFIQIRNISIIGSDSHGISLLLPNVYFDVSPRIVARIVRVYLKLSQIFSEPQVNNIFKPVVSDLNYMLLMQKFATPTPSLTPQVSATDLAQRVSSTPPLTASTVTAKLSSREAKNWRSMERFVHEKGRAIFNLCVEKLIVKQDELVLQIDKLKIVSKISSIGSQFTSINLDKFSINDNIVSKHLTKGGFRIWIDGSLASVQAKVFCLVPPIAIRFDSKFAGMVERYFLEIVDIIKPVSRSNMSSKFIEFLQISSLQLELHAKEMLGVLSLDKAMINLSRSSVYKSDGVLDAVQSLAGQYREELVGQWLSLLMRLDVSIGRPVSTARNLIGGITNFFRNGASTNDLRPDLPKTP